MSTPQSELIVATGVHPVVSKIADVDLPASVLEDQDLSLAAKGLYALLLTQQGQPLDPYVDAFESNETIAAAVEELVQAGLAARVDSSTGTSKRNYLMYPSTE